MNKLVLLVGAGSFIGGILRYLLSQFTQSRIQSAFPLGTLIVNILGCLAIGILIGLNIKSPISFEWRAFLAIGVLGGFTTFSAFSNESVMLLRDGQIGYAFLYISISVLVGLAATFFGIWMMKII